MCQVLLELESIHFKGFYEATDYDAFFKAHLIYACIFDVECKMYCTVMLLNLFFLSFILRSSSYCSQQCLISTDLKYNWQSNIFCHKWADKKAMVPQLIMCYKCKETRTKTARDRISALFRCYNQAHQSRNTIIHSIHGDANVKFNLHNILVLWHIYPWVFWWIR